MDRFLKIYPHKISLIPFIFFPSWLHVKTNPESIKNAVTALYPLKNTIDSFSKPLTNLKSKCENATSRAAIALNPLRLLIILGLVTIVKY